MASLINGNYYHIFNRGTNSQNIFLCNQDYYHFFDLYDVFVEAIAESYAYCLLKNHLHLLIRIKNPEEIGYLNSMNAQSKDPDLKWKTYFPKVNEKDDSKKYIKKPVPEKMIQHLFSTYAKWFNSKHNRTGSLFEHPFKRKHIDNNQYLKRVLVYIHKNPIKHGFCQHLLEYPWSSYLPLIHKEPTKISCNKAMEWFDELDSLRQIHDQEHDFTDIEDYMIEY